VRSESDCRGPGATNLSQTGPELASNSRLLSDQVLAVYDTPSGVLTPSSPAGKSTSKRSLYLIFTIRRQANRSLGDPWIREIVLDALVQMDVKYRTSVELFYLSELHTKRLPKLSRYQSARYVEVVKGQRNNSNRSWPNTSINNWPVLGRLHPACSGIKRPLVYLISSRESDSLNQSQILIALVPIRADR